MLMMLDAFSNEAQSRMQLVQGKHAHPDGSSLQSAAEGVGSVQALGDHSSSQAILGIIGPRDHLRSS